ncbi:MAG: S-adenosylmethionine:tRNA ribosyltransferase-isomerase [Bacteroidales bacterium]|nr:S-adenosylmethionine:tRNA ribosyltransferase-isomerase [Bacteroidales bacterium]
MIDIKISDYNYELPDWRIAKYPLPQRDASKLLRYRNGQVDAFVFRDLPELIPADSVMVFNDTKVVPARLFFLRETGAHIEIFCLEPVDPPEYNTIFAARSSCRWKCVIGNAKRWKGDTLHFANVGGDPCVAALDLTADLVSREGQTGIVELRWQGGDVFSNVLDRCGRVPIPPYLNRDTEAIDLERYQTTYARFRGSVAAPTAGLHFTEAVLARLRAKGVHTETVCLHVGAGTFLPVKSENVADHPMHREPFSVRKSFLERLLAGLRAGAHQPLAAVGTTSVRTLESLYYAGVSCLENGRPEDVGQWDPYTRTYGYSTEEALQALCDYMDTQGMEELKIGTRIIIVPGFRFRLVDLLVTNFHQPESTLLLLISAFVGGDWRTIYDYALDHNFRFLSYGDSSLLYRV